jgi:hypothetical protein
MIGGFLNSRPLPCVTFRVERSLWVLLAQCLLQECEGWPGSEAYTYMRTGIARDHGSEARRDCAARSQAGGLQPVREDLLIKKASRSYL